MLNLKKTAVAVLAFSSSAVFAGTMGPVCTPGNVTVPCESTAWDFGIQALYLKTNYDSGLGYVAHQVTANSTSYVENEPDWSWGFKLEGSYHFSTGNDLNLNWYHLGGKTTSRTLAANTTVDILGQTVIAGTIGVKPRWDAVNLEFGQHVDFGEFENIRFHGGVQYARLKTEFGAAALTGVTPNTVAWVAGSNHTFNGFGPRIGADMSYDLGNGLSVYANGATAILVGTSKASYAVGSTPGVSATFSASRNAMVPEVEAKLGLGYSFAMAQGDLSLDLGYMWVNYFNAQHTVSLTDDSDFALHGPYFGVKWVGTVA